MQNSKRAPARRAGTCGGADTASPYKYDVLFFYLSPVSTLTHIRNPGSTRPVLQIPLLHPLYRQARKMTTPLISNRLASRCTIVTGASSGLGRAIALAFAANGASPIVCTDLRPDSRGDFGVDEASVPTHQLICRRYGEGKAHFIQADVTVSMEVEQVVKKAVEVGGRLDV